MTVMMIARAATVICLRNYNLQRSAQQSIARHFSCTDITIRKLVRYSYKFGRQSGIGNLLHTKNYSNNSKKNISVGGSNKDSKRKQDNKVSTSKIDAKATNDATSISTGAGSSPVTNVQTKTYEIQTKDTILSISTTIEDSKINEIVFQKTKALPSHTTLGANTSAVSTTATSVSGHTDLKAASATKTTTTTSSANPPTVLAQLATAQPNKINEQSIVGSASMSVKVAPVTRNVPPELKPKSARVRVDSNRSSLERNFITPARAMSDFLLKASDLESLSRIKRRSPYEQEPPITVYWRKEVETKAIEIWGSRENLLKETLKREVERKKYQQSKLLIHRRENRNYHQYVLSLRRKFSDIFTVKRRLRDYRREIGYRAFHGHEGGLKGKSGKVVLTALSINGLNFVFKVGGWLYSGSHSMFAEAIHSLADTINQLILAYGLHKSQQIADFEHPYGYTNMTYVASLISGVGIFCIGCGVSVYHGIDGLINPDPISDLFWAFCILSGSLVSEGATLLIAVTELRSAAKENNMTFKQYLLSGKDPCVNVILAEDTAAVTSVVLAASCMALSHITGSPFYDAFGSLLVGGILGGVASFIIYTNVNALVGRSIPEDKLNKINLELESDIMIRAIHDVKGIDMGNSLIRYKAEMDFDGRELTRSYLDKQDLGDLLKAVKSFQTIQELENFLLNHGENIVDLMGGEIDRIEMKLRNSFPEIRHCDLEIL